MVGPKPIWSPRILFNVIFMRLRMVLKCFIVNTIVHCSIYNISISPLVSLSVWPSLSSFRNKEGVDWLDPWPSHVFGLEAAVLCQDSHCSLAGHLQSHLAKSDLPCRWPEGNKHLDWVGCTWRSVRFTCCYYYLRKFWSLLVLFVWSIHSNSNLLERTPEMSGWPVDHWAVLQRRWSPWVAAKT